MGWKPKKGERYWMTLELVPGVGYTCSSIRGSFESSEQEILKGNCYKTEDEAVLALQKIVTNHREPKLTNKPTL